MRLVAATDGSWILMGVLVVMLFGVVYGFYTRSGSGIAAHPTDGRGQAPGAEGPAEESGRDEGEGSNLASHGGR